MGKHPGEAPSCCARGNMARDSPNPRKPHLGHESTSFRLQFFCNLCCPSRSSSSSFSLAYLKKVPASSQSSTGLKIISWELDMGVGMVEE